MKKKGFLAVIVIVLFSLAYSSYAQFNSDFRDTITERAFGDDQFDDDFGDKDFPDEGGFDDRNFEDKHKDEFYDNFDHNRDSPDYRGMGNLEDRKYEFREGRRQDDFGPSYEGFDREEVLFGRVFRYIEEDVNPAVVMQYCNDPNKIADIILEKVKNRIGDVSNICDDAAKEETICQEEAKKHCENFGQPDFSYARDEREKLEILSYSCPVDEQAIKDLCLIQSKEWMEDNLFFVEDNCQDQWEDYGKNDQEFCEEDKKNNICDEDKFIEKCMFNYVEYEEPFQCPSVSKPQCALDYRLEEYYDNKGCVQYECVQNDAPPDPTECPDNYDPVCGDDGVTYQNDCEAREFGLGYQPGECQESCPDNSQEMENRYNECISQNGKPLEVMDRECLIAIDCKIDPEPPAITGQATSDAKDQFLNDCRRQWDDQKRFCRDQRTDCSKERFVSDCVKREKEYVNKDISRLDKQCDRDTRSQIRQMERDCSRRENEKNRCYEESNKRCERLQGIATECKAKVNEENLRKFIIKEAEKKCKFIPFLKNKDFSEFDKAEVTLAVLTTITEEEISQLDDFIENLQDEIELENTIILKGWMNPKDFEKLKRFSFIVDAKISAPESSQRSRDAKEAILSAENPKKVVEKLLQLRDGNIPEEYLYLIEDKADELLDLSQDLDDLSEKNQEKGIGYRLKLFLGFAKEVEDGEIEKLELSKSRLETSIKALGRLAEEVPDDIAQAILKEQVAELERQKEDIDGLIQQKTKKAKGLLRLFGLFG